MQLKKEELKTLYEARDLIKELKGKNDLVNRLNNMISDSEDWMKSNIQVQLNNHKKNYEYHKASSAYYFWRNKYKKALENGDEDRIKICKDKTNKYAKEFNDIKDKTGLGKGYIQYIN